MNEMSRRRLLTVLSGAGLALGTAGRALAFQEAEPSQNLVRMKEDACGRSSSHQKLVDDVNQILGDKYSPEEKQAVIANLSCPVCGCPLSGLF